MNRSELTISEDKKEILMNQKEDIESCLEDLYLSLESDKLNLTDYQKQILELELDKMGSVIGELSDEIYFA